MIYTYTLFADCKDHFFIAKSGIQPAILCANRQIHDEASVILYTQRTAVIALLPRQVYSHGRAQLINQVFRSDTSPSDPRHLRNSDPLSPTPEFTGSVHPCVLQRFTRIRIVIFFPSTIASSFHVIFFDPLMQLKVILQVLSTPPNPQSESDGGAMRSRVPKTLELVLVVCPGQENTVPGTLIEQRISQDFETKGVVGAIRKMQKLRGLKIKGNFTSEGMRRLLEII